MKRKHPIFLCCGIFLASLFYGCSSEVEFTGPSGPKAEPRDAEANPEIPVANQPVVDGETLDEPIVDTVLPEKIYKTVTVEREFKPVTVEALNITHNPEYQYLDQVVTLKELAPSTMSTWQLDRVEDSQLIKQGRDAQKSDPETFLITEAGKLDLLIVVDDSTSMDGEIVNLASKLNPLISKLENTDWQIAVVTTSDPCLRENRLIKKADTDRSTAFAKAIGDIVLSNTVIEKGFPMAIKALKGECKGVTSKWVRPNAAIGILIVSDEDNCGSHAGEGCPGETGETVEQMLGFLADIRPAVQGRIYGLFEGANECGSSAFKATKYKLAVDKTGGTWGSICQNDYTNTLLKISDDVRNIVKREFALKFPPDSGTLLLDIDGVAKTTDYSLSSNILTITGLAATDKKLTVNYSYGSVPKYKVFKVNGNPDPDTIVVTVNDVAVEAGDFSYDPVLKDIAFVNEPVDDAVVKIVYKINTPLPVEFSLSGYDILGPPQTVRVDAVEVSNYTYDANALKVVFDNAPADGKKIDIVFRTKSGRTTRYKAALMNLATARLISAVDRDTGRVVAVATDMEDLVFAADDIIEGRILDVKFDLGYKPDDMLFQLAYLPLLDSLKVDISDQSCEKNIVSSGLEVQIDCGAGKAGAIDISYRAVTSVVSEFAIDADVPSDAVWKVFVDDVIVPDPVLNNRTVSISADAFVDGTKLRIEVSWKEELASDAL